MQNEEDMLITHTAILFSLQSLRVHFRVLCSSRPIFGRVIRGGPFKPFVPDLDARVSSAHRRFARHPKSRIAAQQLSQRISRATRAHTNYMLPEAKNNSANESAGQIRARSTKLDHRMKTSGCAHAKRFDETECEPCVCALFTIAIRSGLVWRAASTASNMGLFAGCVCRSTRLT